MKEFNIQEEINKLEEQFKAVEKKGVKYILVFPASENSKFPKSIYFVRMDVCILLSSNVNKAKVFSSFKGILHTFKTHKNVWICSMKILTTEEAGVVL